MRLRVGELLLQANRISRRKLVEVLALQRETGGRLASLLVDLGLVDELAVAHALVRQHGVPGVCLTSCRIATEVLELVPETSARRDGVLPLGMEGEVLRVAVADPDDRAALLSVTRRSGRRVKPSVAVQSILRRAIRRHYGSGPPSGGEPPRPILVSEAWDAGAVESSLGESSEPSMAHELIPRALLFGGHPVEQVRLSPDGKTVSTIGARDGRRVLRMAPIDHPEGSREVADDSEIDLAWHTWAYSGRHILYGGDREGDEADQVFSVDIHTRVTRHLTRASAFQRVAGIVSHRNARPPVQVDSDLVGLSPYHPEEALVHIRPSAGWWRVYRVNLSSGHRENVTPWEILGGTRYWADSRLHLRIFTCYEDGVETLYARTRNGRWRRLLDLAPDRRCEVLGLDVTGRSVLLLDGSRENFTHLVRVSIVSGRREVLVTPENADIESVWHGGSGVDGVVEFHPRVSIRPVHEAFRRELDFLRSVTPGVPMEVDHAANGRISLIRCVSDRSPSRYYLYDRDSGSVRHLFDAEPRLAKFRFARMIPVNVTARDGLTLPCYLTLPAWLAEAKAGERKTTTPLPTIISVHGGPRARDYWGFDGEVQWLANRGYAVLNVNYRGSTGFGKRLQSAAAHWIAREMLDDVVDATEWAVAAGIADPKRIAILGASYGGFLVLEGLARHPDLYACGVDLCGVTDWRGAVDDDWAARAFDTDVAAARALLEARSPLYRASSISKPLLVAHGTNDVRVPIEDSDRLTTVLAAQKRPVTYLVYEQEGHGFYRGPNLISYAAIVELFLATHLGGRLESLGSDLENATLRIRHGAGLIPGLEPFWKASWAIEEAVARDAEELDLSNFGLGELPPSIGKLSKLRKLRLARNLLTSLPPQIGRLRELRVLEVPANQLLELPRELGDLKRLEHLDICGNQLRALPDELRALPALRRLVVGGNLLDERSLWGFPPRVLRRSRA